MARQGAQVALFADELRAAEDFCGSNRRAPHIRRAREKIGDDRFIFLRLKRTGAVNERPAGLGQSECAIEQAALQPGELDDVLGIFEPRHVGMAANGPGRGARRVEEHAIERLGGPFLDIRGGDFGLERKARKIVAQS